MQKKNREPGATVLFRERQYFRQWWLWLILALVTGDVLWSGWRTCHTGESGDWLSMLLLSLPQVLVVIFIACCRVDTLVTEDGIAARFFPLHRKYRFYPWEEVLEAYVRQYKPLAEYGGWGLRGLGKNRAFNISGSQGLQLVLRDGSRLLVGTQQPETLRQVLWQLPVHGSGQATDHGAE